MESPAAIDAGQPLDGSLTLIRADPRRLKLLEINARYMTSDKYNSLVKNVKHDQALTQIPLAWKLHDDTTQAPILDAEGLPIYLVLSGNHRVMAACDAGLTEIDLQVITAYIPHQRRVALQLSHNAITGDDDPAILKTLYDDLDNVEMKLYAGIDDTTLKLMAEVDTLSLGEAQLVMQVIALTFLEDEVTRLESAIAQARKSARAARYLVGRLADYDRVMDGIEAAAGAAGVKNSAVGLLVILDVFEAHIADLIEYAIDDEGRPVEARRRLSVATVMGDVDPQPVARILRIKAGIEAVQGGGARSEALGNCRAVGRPERG